MTLITPVVIGYIVTNVFFEGKSSLSTDTAYTAGSIELLQSLTTLAKVKIIQFRSWLNEWTSNWEYISSDGFNRDVATYLLWVSQYLD